jgi:hypothetical protein
MLTTGTTSKQAESKITTNRKTAIMAGILFIIATLTPILSGIFLVPLQNATNLLSHVVTHEQQVILGVLLEFGMIIAIVTIPVLLLPVLKRHSETLALGYLAVRIVEVIPFIGGVIGLLLLLTLGQKSLPADMSDVSLPTLGGLLLAINDWAYIVGGQIIFAFTALILNMVLYQSHLVPRWLSVWGLAGVPLMLSAGLLSLFGSSSTVVFIFFVLPLALQEMVFAVWLIVKGFNTFAPASESVKAGKAFA